MPFGYGWRALYCTSDGVLRCNKLSFGLKPLLLIKTLASELSSRLRVIIVKDKETIIVSVS